MNSTSVESPPIAASRSRAVVDRAFAALPLVGLVLAVVTFYCIEAWTRKTVWVFTDELEWTQISRAIEETGHSARRGEPVFFKSLYAYVIAPFWAIGSTSTAYAAIKYADGILMSLAAIPTYLLGRMLLPKRTAVLVALFAIFIPGMAYASSLIPEVIAYPWFALCSWLIVRAMATGRPRAYVWAGLAALLAPLVRNQFATVPAAFVLAAAALWTFSESGRRFRRDWTRGDTIGAIVLLIGAFILFNRVVLQHSYVWQFSTQYWKHRMLDLGLEAGLAFVVGLGILPVIGGLASLRIRERLGDPAYRAFVAWFASSLVCLGMYTAVKATYLSTTTLRVTEERNLIYLSPLMLIGTALLFHSRRINWWLVAAASAFVAYLVLKQPFQLAFPYFEAPGFSILEIPHRHWHWGTGALRLMLVGLVAVSLVLLVLRRRRGVAVAAAVLLGAWLLTAQITATVGFDNFANGLRSQLPQQLDWVDYETGGRPVTFLGQAIIDGNGIQSTEFWNRSLRHVYSLDSTAPGPGPTVTPDVIRPDGTLDAMPDSRYVLAGLGVALQGRLVRREGAFTLYRQDGPPWKLADAVQHVYSDGWAGQESAYTYFRPGQRGTLVVNLGRTGYNGDTPAGVARVRAGTVKILPKGVGPAIDRVTFRSRTPVPNGQEQQLRIPVARTPVRVELNISPTFRANAYDPRQLGAQVSFQFVPAKKVASDDPLRLRVEIARSVADVERLAETWSRVAWEREEAEHEPFLTRLRLRPDVLGPFGVLVLRGDEPVAGLAARIESRRLATSVGYRTLYAPRVRLLQIVDGGIVASDSAALEPLLAALRSALGGQVDAIAVPPLPVGSPLLAALESLGGTFGRQRFIAPWSRRRLVLPASFDEFAASRSKKTRKAMRREERELAAAFGSELTAEVVRDAGGLDRLFRDVDTVARATYQRALGAGFSDTPEQRELARVGLEHGWFRGYLLHLGGTPIAYWLCSTHGDTMLLRTGGYDDAHAHHRPGIHLLMRVIEDAIADPALDVLDFGPGDTLYKQQFSSEAWQERNAVVFAPTVRGLRIVVVRTGILGSSRVARRALDAARLTGRLRAYWRDRLRIRSAR